MVLKPPEAAQTSKTDPKHSGQTAFRYPVGQSWTQEHAQRPRLKKRYMNQRTLARGIDVKAPRKLKSKIWPRVQVSL